ncbi:hypothetical protein NAP1_12138 [Erythrobacter sp. NAP1]|uniref:gene transfer agent family protein n=1 Tax=Erythrobacter sp. NAP1 TaxID=237727 RepID=UPI000068791C|nr:gene transfer agent family protein [Erythrobacter sp. NAP1]EAQ28345.1 hypothetical protein NAP1_12138 [Erythrobacter sp. NAP1]
MAANPHRGETSFSVDGQEFVLRPTFESLVAAEGEIGSLFALVERASEGSLTISEIAALLWHCASEDTRPKREAFGEAVVNGGLVEATKPVRAILAQVLQGKT